MTTTLTQTVARAIVNAYDVGGDSITAARAAIAAIQSSGKWKIVQVEPTQAMLVSVARQAHEDSLNWPETYAAFLSASPKVE